MLRLSRHGIVTGPFDDMIEQEEYRSLVTGQATTLTEMLESFEEEVARIDRDPHLSSEGRTAAKEELTERWKPKLRAALNVEATEKLVRDIERREHSLFVRSNRLSLEDTDLDPEIAKEQVRETRALLRQKLQEEGGDLEVLMIAREAARNDDRVTLRAVEFAPPSFPLLPEEKLRAVQEIHAGERFPEHTEELREMRRALSVLQENSLAGRDAIRKLTGSDPVDSPSFHVVKRNAELEPLDADLEPFNPEPESEPEPEPEPAATA